MTQDTLNKSQELFKKMLTYQKNLNTFGDKNIHEDNENRACFDIRKKIRGWFIERTLKGNTTLKTSYDGGGCEFIGYLDLDEEDMRYIHNYMKEKYQRVGKEFEALK